MDYKGNRLMHTENFDNRRKENKPKHKPPKKKNLHLKIIKKIL